MKELKDYGLMESPKKMLCLLDVCFPEGRPATTSVTKSKTTKKPEPEDTVDVESDSEDDGPKNEAKNLTLKDEVQVEESDVVVATDDAVKGANQPESVKEEQAGDEESKPAEKDEKDGDEESA
jgi:hypothetical protein